MMPCGIPELGDGVAGAGAEGTAALGDEAGKFHEAVLLRLAGELGVLAGEVAVVHGPDFAAVVFGDVAAFQNPVAAQGGEAFVGAAAKAGSPQGPEQS